MRTLTLLLLLGLTSTVWAQTPPLRADIAGQFKKEPNAPAARLIASIFAADESANADAFVKLLTDDVHMYYGSQPAWVGKADVHKQVSDFFTYAIKNMKHHLLDVVKHSDKLVCYRAEVTFTRKDDGVVTLPYMVYLGMKGPLVQSYNIFIDTTPLFAPAKP